MDHQVFPLRAIELLHSVCIAKTGERLEDCTRDAIILAAATGKDVHFIHNDTTYVAERDVLVDSVLPKEVPVNPRGEIK